MIGMIKGGAIGLAIGLTAGGIGAWKAAHWQRDSEILAVVEDHKETDQVNEKTDFKAAARRNIDRAMLDAFTTRQIMEATKDAENDDHCGLTELGSMRYNAFLERMPVEHRPDSTKANAPAN